MVKINCDISFKQFGNDLLNVVKTKNANGDKVFRKFKDYPWEICKVAYHNPVQTLIITVAFFHLGMLFFPFYILGTISALAYVLNGKKIIAATKKQLTDPDFYKNISKQLSVKKGTQVDTSPKGSKDSDGEDSRLDDDMQSYPADSHENTHNDGSNT